MSQNVRPENLPDQCWSAIGSWSARPTCPVLNDLFHCRNCSVYIQHGRCLLDRATIPAVLRQDWTTSIAQSRQESLLLSESALVFRLLDEYFALSTSVFDEVILVLPIHSIPHRNDKIVRGFAAFRGRLELCISLENLLGLTGDIQQPSSLSKRDERRMLVVSRGEDSRFLFQAPAVLGTCRYAPQDLKLARTDENRFFPYLDGVFQYRDRAVGLINSGLLFESIERGFVQR